MDFSRKPLGLLGTIIHVLPKGAEMIMNEVESAKLRMEIGGRIDKARVAANMSIADLAECTSLKPSAIADIIHGRTQKLSIYVLKEISIAVGVSIARFFDDRDPQAGATSDATEEPTLSHLPSSDELRR